ncbi:MAG: FAD:protein FMN transferase, partial [Oscillospiraceae bacterium]|nr:FAD:protein FMN transferase [Oscillospiraceae bacterium]
GLPAESGLLSVTLVGQCASELDALATAAFILGADAAMPILRNRGIEAVFVTETGEVLVTPDLQADFQLFQQKGA